MSTHYQPFVVSDKSSFAFHRSVLSLQLASNRWRICLLIFILSTAQSTLTLAQTAPTNSADIAAQEQLRQQERERVQRQQQETRPDVRLSAPVVLPEGVSSAELDEFLPTDETPCFTIHSLHLVGDESARFQWLLEHADQTQSGQEDKVIGRCLGTRSINIILHRLQAALTQRGWITTRVLVEPQDLANGQLHLNLLPGRVGQIRLSPNAQGELPKRANLGTAFPIRPGDLLNLRDLEQGLENLRRIEPAIPGGISREGKPGGCTGVFGSPITTPACVTWRKDYEQWNVSYQASLDALSIPVNAYNASVNEDNRLHVFEDYTWYELTGSPSRSQVTSTAPSIISVGGNLNVTGNGASDAKLTNEDSQIIVGGNINLTDTALNNQETKGTYRVQYNGTAQFTTIETCGTFGDRHCREWHGKTAHNPAPEITTIDLPTGARYVSNSTSSSTSTSSTIVADADINVKAGRDIQVISDINTRSENHYKDKKTSGIMGSGGFGISIGSRELSNDQKNRRTTATASSIGSLGTNNSGNVNVDAGRHYQQTGSDVLALKGDVNITAQQVDINEARETQHVASETQFKQTGVTVAISTPVLTAIQTVEQMSTAAGNTSDGRMKALAAATSALAVDRAAGAVLAGQGQTINGKANQIVTGTNPDGTLATRDANAIDKIGGVDISVSFGTSKSHSQSAQTSDTSARSHVAAGKDVYIAAMNDAKATEESKLTNNNLTIQGSQVNAGNTITLQADDEILLQAAKETFQQRSKNNSSSASAGMSFGTNGVVVNLAGSQGRGKGNGDDITWVNTEINGQEKVTITSGTNTTIKGAVVSATEIVTDVGNQGQGN